MGKALVAAIAANPEFTLAGATEYPASPVIGQDAGTVAGVAALNVPVSASLTPEMLSNADAIIDFSTGNVLENARAAAKAGLSIVIGTTALTDADKAALRELSAQGARIVQTFNYSVGVNLLFFLSGKTGVYEIIPGFICCFILAVVVSLIDSEPSADVQALYAKATDNSVDD